MGLPVLIFADDLACERTLAGLSVLERLVIATHEAGATAISILHGKTEPKFTALDRLKIEVHLTREEPAFRAPTLLISGNLALQRSDLERVMKQQGRLHAPGHELLPCGVAAEWAGSLEASLPRRPKMEARGVAQPVKDGLTAVQAEDALWDTMGLETDSFMDRNFNRPVGRLASRLLIHTSVSPNAISVVATGIGVLSAIYFARGEAHLMIVGAVLLQCSAIIDCVDGDLARMSHKESRTGKWLDLGGDQLVHLCLMAGIGMGLYRMHDQSGPWLWLGIAAALGVVLSFLTRLRAEQSERPLPLLQAWIARAANRDFSALLLILTIVERVDLFLWLALVAVHGFWIYGEWLRRQDAIEA